MLNEEELKDAALLVFANKQDQPGAKGAGDISQALRLGELRDRNWSIMACSAVDGSGVSEGMDWLVVRISWLSIVSEEETLAANAHLANGLSGLKALWHRGACHLPCYYCLCQILIEGRQQRKKLELSNGVHWGKRASIYYNGTQFQDSGQAKLHYTGVERMVYIWFM